VLIKQQRFLIAYGFIPSPNIAMPILIDLFASARTNKVYS
jgi:hypothetical protein